MSQNLTSNLITQLVAIEEAVSSIVNLGQQTDALTQSINEHGSVTKSQLELFQQRSEQLQTSLALLLDIGQKFETFTATGTNVASQLSEISSNFNTSTAQSINTINELSTHLTGLADNTTEKVSAAIESLIYDFKENIARAHESLTMSKVLLSEQLQVSSTELLAVSRQVRDNLENLPEQMANRIQKLAEPSFEVLHQSTDEIATKLETILAPSISTYVSTVRTSEDAIKGITESLQEEFHKILTQSRESFAETLHTHESSIQRTNETSDRLKVLLDNSEALNRLTSATEQNLAIHKDIQSMLKQKKAPFIMLLDAAAVGTVGGFLVGKSILNVSDAELLIVLVPGFITTITGLTLISNLKALISSSKDKQWSPPSPQT
jgi:uncharacterized protein YoxC